MEEMAMCVQYNGHKSESYEKQTLREYWKYRNGRGLLGDKLATAFWVKNIRIYTVTITSIQTLRLNEWEKLLLCNTLSVDFWQNNRIGLCKKVDYICVYEGYRMLAEKHKRRDKYTNSCLKSHKAGIMNNKQERKVRNDSTQKHGRGTNCYCCWAGRGLDLISTIFHVVKSWKVWIGTERDEHQREPYRIVQFPFAAGLWSTKEKFICQLLTRHFPIPMRRRICTPLHFATAWELSTIIITHFYLIFFCFLLVSSEKHPIQRNGMFLAADILSFLQWNSICVSCGLCIYSRMHTFCYRVAVFHDSRYSNIVEN